MGQNALYDLKNNLSGDTSNEPGVTLSGTTADNGDSVDCAAAEGTVQGIFQVGAAGGSPDSYTVTCKLQESDDGTNNWGDCKNMSSLVLSADKSIGFVRANRTKRYVRSVMTPAFTGGSSPSIAVAGTVLFAKKVL